MGRLATVVVLVVAWLLAGCGAEGPSSTASDSTAPPSAVSSSPDPTGPGTAGSDPAGPRPSQGASLSGTVITTASSAFGIILFDRSGQAIYLFDKEQTPAPQCYGDCAAAWPPVLTTGSPRATGAARPTLLGTTTRDDGSRQVTYAGHPLYFYAHEGKHQVLCHNVSEFGGLWLVVTPGGTPAA
jgi:predicted lipoprotein with Yx(FWY)xxD motif